MRDRQVSGKKVLASPAPAPYAADGVTRTMEVAVTLRKAEPASWVDLIKTWYT